MPRKSIFNLTSEEKKRLRSKKVSQTNLENYSALQIAEILNVPIERARDIVFGDLKCDSPSEFSNSWLAALQQIDSSVRPLQSLGIGLSHQINQSVGSMTLTGMAKMLTQANQNIAIGGAASDLFQQSVLISKRLEHLKINDWVGKVAITGLTHPGLNAAIIEILKSNRATQNVLGNFTWGSLAQKIGADSTRITATYRKFLDLSTGYTGILQALSLETTKFERYPILAKLPTIEYRTHTSVLEIMSSEDVVLDKYNDLTLETTESINTNLPQLNSAFLKMWIGAKEALKSANPDRIRHFSTSVRELLTQIIHVMAPDDLIRSWSQEESDFANGKPTRRTRFKYICRTLDSGSYSNFLKKDITAMVGLFDLFQIGTHGIEPDFTEDQLFAIQFRVESALRFLLEIEFSVNRL